FEMAGLGGTEPMTINVEAQGYVGAKVENVAPGTKDLRISMTKGLTASGRVVDASGKAVANTQVGLRHSDGTHRQRAQTEGDGRFTADGFVEGSYEVQVYVRQADGRSTKAQSAGSLKAGDRDVELRLPQ